MVSFLLHSVVQMLVYLQKQGFQNEQEHPLPLNRLVVKTHLPYIYYVCVLVVFRILYIKYRKNMQYLSH